MNNVHKLQFLHKDNLKNTKNGCLYTETIDKNKNLGGESAKKRFF
jgi:hypothetical protein